MNALSTVFVLCWHGFVESMISVNSVARISSSGLGDFDGFGSAISLSEGRFIVTQNFHESTKERNVVIVYERRNYENSWVESAILRAESRGHSLDNYGSELSLAGSLALVGAFAGSDRGSQSGYAFIFRAQGSRWTQSAKLVAPDGGPNDKFASSVCLYEGMAWIGAPGKKTVYIYRQSSDLSWFVHDKLTQPNSPGFGSALSGHGHVVAIGASSDSTGGAGAVYVYETTAMDTWEHSATLLGPHVDLQDGFGHAVSVYDDSIVVGAPYDNDNGHHAGSAWIFSRNTAGSVRTEWTNLARLSPSDLSPSDNFGFSVAVNDRWAVVSVEPYWADGIPPGSVYFFDKFSGYELLDGLLGMDGTARFVNVVGNTVLVGGPSSDDFGHASGAVYVLEMQVDPTATPTAPSEAPTLLPTSPTGQPSGYPSFVPTSCPSEVPSCVPTASPSSPTNSPTSTPSNLPSGHPTQAPSRPTMNPTTVPSALPSMEPSSAPSAPSSMPTLVPSSVPTTVPSSDPTSLPTASPAAPSAAPSCYPTVFSTKLIQSLESRSSTGLSVGMTVGLFAIASAVVGAIAGYIVYMSRRMQDKAAIESAYEMRIGRDVLDALY